MDPTRGVLVLLDVPPGTEVGMDLRSWTVGDRFRGLTRIPAGVHLLHYRVLDRHGASSPRHVSVVSLGAGQVWIRRWSAATEEFACVDPEEEERLVDGVRSLAFDANLGPYPHDAGEDWALLTSHAKEVPLREEHFVFTDLRRERFLPSGAPPDDVTRFMMDRSRHLESVLVTDMNGNLSRFLGEVQCAFVLFLVGESLEGLEQWKIAISLLCSCVEALTRRSDFFAEFMDVLRVQLTHLPTDFFHDDLSQDNFLRPALKGFFELTADCAPSLSFERSKHRLLSLISQRFQWDYSLEEWTDSDAPVLVEL